MHRGIACAAQRGRRCESQLRILCNAHCDTDHPAYPIPASFHASSKPPLLLLSIFPSSVFHESTPSSLRSFSSIPSLASLHHHGSAACHTVAGPLYSIGPPEEAIPPSLSLSSRLSSSASFAPLLFFCALVYADSLAFVAKCSEPA